MLDVVDQPHWLKSFVLHFSVLVASKLDDQADPGVSRAVAQQQSGAPSMANIEQPSGDMLMSRAESMHSQSGASIARASMTELDKIVDQGWLPAKLLPPESDSSGKQKQAKKRSKQKAKSNAQSSQKGEGGQPAKTGTHDLSSCGPAHAGDSKWELQHADCMDEAANGKAFSDDSAEDHTFRMEGSLPEPAGQPQSGTTPDAHAGDDLHVKEREGNTAAGEGLQLPAFACLSVNVFQLGLGWRFCKASAFSFFAKQMPDMCVPFAQQALPAKSCRSLQLRWAQCLM